MLGLPLRDSGGQREVEMLLKHPTVASVPALFKLIQLLSGLAFTGKLEGLWCSLIFPLSVTIYT